MVNVGESVFRSEGERAAWLLLRAYLHELEGGYWAALDCLAYAYEALGLPWGSWVNDETFKAAIEEGIRDMEAVRANEPTLPGFFR